MQTQQCTGLCSLNCHNLYVCSVSYANINGTKYSKGCILLCNIHHDEPLFGKLTDLIVSRGVCWFVMKTCLPQRFNQHYNAYEVELINEHIILKQEDLIDSHPLSLTKSFDTAISSYFVTLKYHVF